MGQRRQFLGRCLGADRSRRLGRAGATDSISPVVSVESSCECLLGGVYRLLQRTISGFAYWKGYVGMAIRYLAFPMNT